MKIGCCGGGRTKDRRAPNGKEELGDHFEVVGLDRKDESGWRMGKGTLGL